MFAQPVSALLVLGCLAAAGGANAVTPASSPVHVVTDAATLEDAAQNRAAAHRRLVIVPGEDRFTPFNQTIHVGELIVWENRDTDDHTVVSDDGFNTTGPHQLDVLLPGTDSNGGKPGRIGIYFTQPGTFVYHCRFHSHLDDAQQPVAPGPKQGIQDANGNYGTPMMGTITVLP